ncbi:MAG: alpha/beta hydrolase [Burkholderiaceae bacterium]|nr:alpha/beta hydrolase [Burkholderiaceae bacterium]
MQATVAGEPLLHHRVANGITQAHFEWRAELRGRRSSLCMVHATGFHGRVWDQVIHHLPDHHVIAVELRGHGRSQAADFTGWADFGHDLAALAATLDLQGVVGIGHSMGAHALVQAAACQPGRFSQLVLIDPTIFAPAEYHRPPLPGVLQPAAARKNHFESAQAMFQRFAGRPPYNVFQRQALLDYCRHGLHPADSGSGFRLACAPAVEGKVYALARGNPGIFTSIRALRIPVLVVRARLPDPGILPWDPLGSPTWPGLALEFRHGRDLARVDKTHMLPMEDPALVARLITEAMAQAVRL